MAGELNHTMTLLSSIITNYLSWLPNKYLQSLAILGIFFALSWGSMKVLQRVVLEIAKKTRTKLDERIVQHTNRPLATLLLLIGIRLAIMTLSLTRPADRISETIIFSLGVFVVAYIIIAVFDAVIEASSRRWASRAQMVKLFYRFTRIILMLLALAAVLSLWGIKIGPLLAGLGVAGIAIGFALQATLGNIFGGISLIMDGAYKAGDIIKLESGEMGIVTKVGIRSTRVRTWDNELLIVPNGKIADSKVQNLMQPDNKIRAVIEFGVEYGSDVSKVKKTALTALKGLDVMKEPEPMVIFHEMGDFALKFSLRFWVDDVTKRFLTKEAATCNLYNALRKAKIGIPFPTRTIYTKKAR